MARPFHPVPVAPLDVFAERQIALARLVDQRLFQSQLRMLVELQPPAGEADVEVDPLLVRQVPHQCAGDVVEFLDVVLRDRRSGDLTPLQELLARHKDLAGVDGLGQVVADLLADRLFHQRFFLVLRDHDHGEAGAKFLDLRERAESPHPRHHLIEEHEIVFRLLHHRDRVLAVGGGVDGVPLFAEIPHVGTQELDLIIDPEDSPFLFFHVFSVSLR